MLDSDKPSTIAPNQFPFYETEPIAPRQDKPTLASVSESVPQGPGSRFDSDTVDGIQAVTATAAAPNALVATDNSGKLPSSVLGNAYAGPSVQAQPVRAFATTYQNTNTTALFVTVSASLTAGTLQALVDTSSPPTTVVTSNGVGGGQTHTFVVLPNYYYRFVHGGTATLNYWTEWY